VTASPPAADLSKLRINRDDPPPAVKRALRRVLWLVGAAVLIVAVVVVIGRRGGAVPVQVVTVTTAAHGGEGAAGGGNSGSVAVVANGYVVARTKAAVSAKIPGRLAVLNVSEGSRVEKGAIIARLDNADYAAAVGQAEAELASAKATLIETQSDRDQLQREFVRVRDIRAQNPNLVSPQDVENADSKARQADARVSAQQARVDAAGAGLRVAQANLENTYIRAPFGGTVLRKEAEVGEVVAPSVGGGLTRGAVVTMADLATLEVEVDVNEAYIARIQGGQQARITLDAYPDTSFRGTVRQVVPTADRQRATVQVKVAKWARRSSSSRRRAPLRPDPRRWSSDRGSWCRPRPSVPRTAAPWSGSSVTDGYRSVTLTQVRSAVISARFVPVSLVASSYWSVVLKLRVKVNALRSGSNSGMRSVVCRGAACCAPTHQQS